MASLRGTVLLSLLASTSGAAAQESRAAGAAPAATLTLVGTCRGHDPQAKEPVRLTLWQHDYNRDAAILVRDIRSDASGAFTFADVPWLTGHAWGFAFFVLFARQGDRVGLVQLRGDDAGKAPLEITLATGVTLRGRATAASGGGAVANGAVRLLGLAHDKQWCFFAETPPQWTATTRADGTFTIPGVPPGWACTVTCVAEKFMRTRLDQDSTERFDFELPPGAVLVGRVLLADGKPAVRARVCAQGRRSNAWETTTTDDRGGYRLVGLPEDTFNVWTDIEDLTCVALDSQQVTAGQETSAPDLIAIAGGFLVGRVIDAATGQPVQPGASGDVAVYGPSRPRSGAGCAISPVRPDGTFRIRVAPGSNFIYVRCGEGFEEQAPANHTVDVEAGQERQVEFKVRRNEKAGNAAPGRPR